MVTFRDGGRRASSMMPISDRPLRLTIADGAFSVLELPETHRLVELKTPAARRLAELAIHEHSLEEAESACLLLESIVAPKGPNVDGNEPIERALWAAMTTSYYRCFGESGAKLRWEEVLSGSPAGQQVHQYFHTLRDKHFSHDINGYRQSIVAAALDNQGQVLGVMKNQSLVVHSLADMVHFKALIGTSLAFVRRSMVGLLQQVDAELDAQSPEALLAMDEPVYVPPGPQNATKPRRNKPAK